MDRRALRYFTWRGRWKRASVVDVSRKRCQGASRRATVFSRWRGGWWRKVPRVAVGHARGLDVAMEKSASLRVRPGSSSPRRQSGANQARPIGHRHSLRPRHFERNRLDELRGMASVGEILPLPARGFKCCHCDWPACRKVLAPCLVIPVQRAVLGECCSCTKRSPSRMAAAGEKERVARAHRSCSRTSQRHPGHVLMHGKAILGAANSWGRSNSSKAFVPWAKQQLPMLGVVTPVRRNVVAGRAPRPYLVFERVTPTCRVIDRPEPGVEAEAIAAEFRWIAASTTPSTATAATAASTALPPRAQHSMAVEGGHRDRGCRHPFTAWTELCPGRWKLY